VAADQMSAEEENLVREMLGSDLAQGPEDLETNDQLM
jgi:hypothetical protein